MKKPVTPLLHGLIDYAIVLSLLTVPRPLGVNPKAVKIYTLLGLNLGLYNALTDHGASALPLIPFKTHYKVDYFNLALVAALLLQKDILKDKKARRFHAVFFTVAALTVFLTDTKNVNAGKHSLA